jgi:hypothetical protein
MSYFFKSNAALAILSAILVTQTAQADDLILLGVDGQKPNRVVTYADASSVRENVRPEDIQRLYDGKRSIEEIDRLSREAKVMYMRLVQIHENANEPDSTFLTAEFRMRDTRWRLLDGTRQFRHDARQEKLSATNWDLPELDWQKRAVNLTEAEQVWKIPVKRAAENHASTGVMEEVPEIRSLGMKFVGHFVTISSISDYTWKTFWPDGQRVAYTTSKSPEEIDKMKKEHLAKLAEGSKLLDEHKKKVETSMKADKIRQTNSTPGGALAQWMGAKEGELVRQWGNPTSVSSSGNVANYTYRKERIEDIMQHSTINGATSIRKVGENRYYTDTTFSLVNGIIIDAHVQSNDPKP